MSTIDKKVADLIQSFKGVDTCEIDDIDLPLTNKLLSVSESSHKKKYLGSTIGQWKLQKLLGKGGMSLVFLVSREAADFQQKAAMKIITSSTSYPSHIDRFHQERQILTNLNHQHITKLYDGGMTEDGKLWYVMEYIDGDNLIDYVKKTDINIKQRLKLFLQICDALAYSHRSGIIHRDIKPANIFVDHNDQIKLFDFGIAHHMEKDLSLTKTGSILGTPGYMSPEQITGQGSIDQRTDVFSLGILLCELLCEQKPFDGNSVTDISNKIVHEPIGISLRSLDRDLSIIINTCLRKKQHNRYAGVVQLKRDIEAYLNHEVISAKSISLTYKMSKLLSKYPKISLSLMTLSILLCLSILYGFIQANTNNQQLLITERVIAAVNSIDSDMRRMYMMPLHNTQLSYENHVNTVEQLQAKVTNSTVKNKAMVFYLLGKAYLSLRKYETALEYFQFAQKKGFQSDDFNQGYALSLLNVWNKKKKQLNNQKDHMKRDQMARIIDDQFYRPLEFTVKKINKDSYLSDFLGAHLAFIEEDHSKAIEFLDRTIEDLPWYYEALRMKAEVLLKQVGLIYKKNGPQAGLKQLKVSKQVLQKAIAIGRSDPLNYNLLCAVIATEVQLYRVQNELNSQQQLLDEAEQTCQSALMLDQSAQAPWTNIAQVMLAMAFEKSDDDPAKIDLYQKVIHSLQKATNLHPDNVSIAAKLSESISLLAVSYSKIGKDPLPGFARSQEILLHWSQKYPKYSKIWTELARISSERGNHFNENNKWQMASVNYQKAIDYLGKSYDLTQSNVAKLNMALIKTLLYEIRKKQSNTQQAINDLSESLDISFQLAPRYYSQLGSFERLIQLNIELLTLKFHNNALQQNDIVSLSKRIVQQCQNEKKGDNGSLNKIIAELNKHNWMSEYQVEPCKNE